MNTIFTRRSVRQFLDKEVEQVKIEKLLRAGMQAPSGGNQQPWEFLVVAGKENLEKLSNFTPNIAIIVCGNKERMRLPQFWEQDLGAVTQNIQLQAVELGLGSVWIGTAPNDEKMAKIRELYNLKENILPYSILAIGYPIDDNANQFIDRYDESRVTYIR